MLGHVDITLRFSMIFFITVLAVVLSNELLFSLYNRLYCCPVTRKHDFRILSACRADLCLFAQYIVLYSVVHRVGGLPMNVHCLPNLNRVLLQ